MSENDLKSAVRQKYGEAALTVLGGGAASCCGAAPCDPISSALYAPPEAAGLPEQALEASLGCGNPTALAELRQGETVLDLGCGGGIDVLLAAQRVGPAGKAYGLDMTDEMLALAEENKRKSGLANVEFLKGDMENIPLPESSVDVVISNCVINLSPEKDRVFREAFRVLKPGGRMLISDLVLSKPLPERLRESIDLYSACVAGAMPKNDYLREIEAAGFRDIKVVSESSFPAEFALEDSKLSAVAGKLKVSPGELARAIGSIISLNVRAVKEKALD